MTDSKILRLGTPSYAIQHIPTLAELLEGVEFSDEYWGCGTVRPSLRIGETSGGQGVKVHILLDYTFIHVLPGVLHRFGPRYGRPCKVGDIWNSTTMCQRDGDRPREDAEQYDVKNLSCSICGGWSSIQRFIAYHRKGSKISQLLKDTRDLSSTFRRVLVAIEREGLMSSNNPSRVRTLNTMLEGKLLRRGKKGTFVLASKGKRVIGQLRELAENGYDHLEWL